MGIISDIFGEKKLNKKASLDLAKNKKKETKSSKKIEVEKIETKVPKTKKSKSKEKLNIDLSKKDLNEPKKDEFIKTYVPGFDEMVNPGIPRGSAVLIEGSPGSGKTLFCLTTLRELCKRGKKVLYMSFEEPEERLKSHIKEFGIDPDEMEKKGLLYIKRFNALDIARSVEALLSEAKKELLIDVQPVLIPQDFKADIVLIDSLTSISSAFSGESSRFRIYMEQLFRYLEAHKITSFLIREVASPTHVGLTYGGQEEAVSFLSDGIIAIYNVFYPTGIRKRAIEIVKMRGVNIDRKVVEYEITQKGVIVHPEKQIIGDYKLT